MRKETGIITPLEEDAVKIVLEIGIVITSVDLAYQDIVPLTLRIALTSRTNPISTRFSGSLQTHPTILMTKN